MIIYHLLSLSVPYHCPAPGIEHLCPVSQLAMEEAGQAGNYWEWAGEVLCQAAGENSLCRRYLDGLPETGIWAPTQGGCDGLRGEFVLSRDPESRRLPGQ